MSNCKSGLITGHELVDISDPENMGDTYEALINVLRVDADLEDDINDIVKGIMKGKAVQTLKEFEEVFDEAFSLINSQDFYGSCEFSIIKVPNFSTLSVSWAVGGHTD